MTLTGVVHEGKIVMDPGPALPEGTRVKILAELTEETEKPAFLDLLQFAGCIKDMPADFALQHDHYIHGTPKK